MCGSSPQDFGSPRIICSHPVAVVTGSNEQPAGPGVPLGPGLRTESPQPVSSAKRRLSTDAMQLREVGKLDVYLRKIHWLQRPSPGVPPWALRPWGQPGPLASPGVGAGGPAGGPPPGGACPHPLCLLVAGGLPAAPARVRGTARLRDYVVARVELLLCRGI